MKSNLKNKKGFTIIELMIATAVFGAILILCMGSFVQIGRMYYKGVTNAKVQEATRSITDEITRALQFSSDRVAVSAGNDAYCIGLTRYSFVTKKTIDDSLVDSFHSKHVLWRDTETRAGAICNFRPASSDADFVSNGTKPGNLAELVTEGMRVNELKLEPLDGSPFNSTTTSSSSGWRVTVSLSYGDRDLFENPGATDSSIDYSKCKGSSTIGTQFCGVSTLSTIVARRLQ